MTCTDRNGRRRLDNPNDFIRLEVGIALARNVRVIRDPGRRRGHADRLGASLPISKGSPDGRPSSCATPDGTRTSRSLAAVLGARAWLEDGRGADGAGKQLRAGTRGCGGLPRSHSLPRLVAVVALSLVAVRQHLPRRLNGRQAPRPRPSSASLSKRSRQLPRHPDPSQNESGAGHWAADSNAGSPGAATRAFDNDFTGNNGAGGNASGHGTDATRASCSGAAASAADNNAADNSASDNNT